MLGTALVSTSRIPRSRALLLRPFSATTEKESIIFTYPDAAKKIRVLSGCSTIHASYWVGYCGYNVIDSFAINNGTVNLSSSDIAAEATSLIGYSHYWSTLGLCLGGIFLILAQVNASCVVGKINLFKQDGEFRGNSLLVRNHNFFGGLEKEGTVYKAWNAATGPSIKSYNESKRMITFLPVGNKMPTFHHVIDTENGHLIDKQELLDALAMSTEPRSETQAPSGTKLSRSEALNKSRKKKHGHLNSTFR